MKKLRSEVKSKIIENIPFFKEVTLVAGLPRVGYNHYTDMFLGQPISKGSAELYLYSDIAFAESEVQRLDNNLPQCRFEALIALLLIYPVNSINEVKEIISKDTLDEATKRMNESLERVESKDFIMKLWNDTLC